MQDARILATSAHSSGIKSSIFSTNDVESSRKIEYWRDLHEGIAEVRVEPDRPSGAASRFSGRLETWRLGPFFVMDAESTDIRLERRALPSIRDRPEQWSVRMSLDRPWRTRLGDDAFRVEAGAPFLQRVGGQAEADLPPGRWRVLLISGNCSPELSRGLRRLRAGPQSGPVAGLFAAMLSALPDQLRAASDGDAPALQEALRAMCSGCLLGGLAGTPVMPGDIAVLERERVLRLIRRNIGSARLDVDRICRLAGLSRSTLYRMFEETGGVASLVRDLRLEQVMRELRDPRCAAFPISVLAERAGFHCPASFSRVFRQNYGCAPSEARAAASGGARLAQRDDDAMLSTRPSGTGRLKA